VPREGVRVPNVVGQSLSDSGKQRVAGGMAEVEIDLFESVQVHQQHGETGIRAQVGALQCIPQVLQQVASRGRCAVR